MNAQTVKNDFLFVLHCIFAMGAFFLPFLVSWQIAVPVLLLTVAQHIIFGRCLLMQKHGVDESDGSTFYSHLLELMGFNPPKKAIRFFVRKILYMLISAVTLWWQVYLGNEPLLF